MKEFIKAYELLEMRKALMSAKVSYNEIKRIDDIINELPLQEVLDAQEFVNHI